MFWLLLVSGFSLGAVTLLAQLAIVRELVAVFTGNELFLGLGLAAWLAGTAFGAGQLARRLPLRTSTSLLQPLAATSVLLSLILPLGILSARAARFGLGLAPGVEAGPLAMLMATLIAAGPAAAAGGLIYALLLRQGELVLTSPARSGAGPWPAWLFAAEAAGACAAGLVYTFGLAWHWDPWWLCAFLWSAAGLIAVAVGLAVANRGWLILGLVLNGLLLAQPGVWLERLSMPWTQVPGRRLVSLDTARGRAELYRDGDQYSAVYSGTRAFSVPDAAAAETAARIPCLAAPAHGRVAVFGGGPEVVADLLARPGLERLTVFIPDPQAQAAWQRVLPAAWTAPYSDPRVEVYPGDGRRGIRRAGTRWDLVLLDLTLPVNLAENRFFTLEFLQQLSAHLSPAGLVAYVLPYSPNRLFPQEADLLGAVWQTLGRVFPHRALLAGDQLFLLASPGTQLEALTPARLAAAANAERPASRVLPPAAIPLVFDARRSAALRWELEAVPRPENTDRRPVVAGLQTGLWLQQRLGPAAVLILLLALFLAVFFIGRRGPNLPWPHSAPWLGAAGAAAMALELFVLFAFQSTHGDLWQDLGLLFAAYMAGSAAGALLSAILNSRWAALGWTLGLVLLMVAGPGWVFATHGDPVWALAVLAAGGLCAGGIYGGLNRDADAGAASAGWSADLTGSVIGALLANTVLMPWLGPYAGLVPAAVLLGVLPFTGRRH